MQAEVHAQDTSKRRYHNASHQQLQSCTSKSPLFLCMVFHKGEGPPVASIYSFTKDLALADCLFCKPSTGAEKEIAAQNVVPFRTEVVQKDLQHSTETIQASLKISYLGPTSFASFDHMFCLYVHPQCSPQHNESGLPCRTCKGMTCELYCAELCTA